MNAALLADLFPTKVDDNGVLVVMLEFTAVVLFVVGICIFFFARWSKKEKAKRLRDVNTAINLKD
ncbi:MAG TPA: hypothetical protein VHE55_18255 [Fimbriimonadaceae bacterium]|nr:hypothetical protein [Fimbriimonadaceae bacterium]